MIDLFFVVSLWFQNTQMKHHFYSLLLWEILKTLSHTSPVDYELNDHGSGGMWCILQYHCPSQYSIAVKRHHDHGNKRKNLVFAYSFRGLVYCQHGTIQRDMVLE